MLAVGDGQGGERSMAALPMRHLRSSVGVARRIGSGARRCKCNCEPATNSGLPSVASISSQLVFESAFEAGNAEDRNHARSAADLVGCFPLTCLAILDRLRQRLVEGRWLRPGSHVPHLWHSLWLCSRESSSGKSTCAVLEPSPGVCLPSAITSNTPSPRAASSGRRKSLSHAARTGDFSVAIPAVRRAGPRPSDRDW
jgi:hypothetical protein